MRRLTAILGLASLLVAGTAQAAAYDDAFAAYQKGDYAQALKLFMPLAEKGDAKAQYNVGTMYNNSLGVKTDYAEAAKWYRKSADQGNMYAQVDLALLYEYGRGV